MRFIEHEVTFETRINGIPSIVTARITPEEGDNWNDPYIPAHVSSLVVMDMREKPCKWRAKRMTAEDRHRIEKEALEWQRIEQEEYACP